MVPPAPDEPLTYYVDSWGTPIDYFSTCSATGDAAADYVPRVNARRDASTAFVHLNDGLPLLVSYGPDGRANPRPNSASATEENGTSAPLGVRIRIVSRSPSDRRADSG